MRWHVRYGVNVYERDRAICQCHNEQDAKRIVDAVNAQERKEDADQKIEPTSEQRAAPHAVGGPLNVLDEDAMKCCIKAFRTFPTTDLAVCPICGLTYRAEDVSGVRYWRIKPDKPLIFRS